MDESTLKTIDCLALHRAGLTGPIDLIDVRTPEEFAEIHAAGARNVPLDILDPATIVRTRTTPADSPLFFICAVGGRSAWACELMIAAGHTNVVNVVGGTQAWYQAGLPVDSGA